MRQSPTAFLKGLLCVILLFPAAVNGQALRVVLLGTGTPDVSMKRFGAGILVEGGRQRFLFDCGRGAVLRLSQLHIPLAEVNRVFLTHLHSDHTVGIPDLWLTGWIFDRRDLCLFHWRGVKARLRFSTYYEGFLCRRRTFELAT